MEKKEKQGEEFVLKRSLTSLPLLFGFPDNNLSWETCQLSEAIGCEAIFINKSQNTAKVINLCQCNTGFLIEVF